MRHVFLNDPQIKRSDKITSEYHFTVNNNRNNNPHKIKDLFKPRPFFTICVVWLTRLILKWVYATYPTFQLIGSPILGKWSDIYGSWLPQRQRKHPIKGDTIQYIYTDPQHNNPLCRVVPIENLAAESLPPYDKEKYKEMILDAAETVLGFFGFDRASYSNHKVGRKWRWYEELREQRTRDIENEML